MSNIWVFTPSFCKAKLLEDFFNHIGDLKAQNPGLTLNHVVIDNNYPVNKVQNSIRLKEIAHKNGATYIDSGRDLGLHNGLNNACAQLPITGEDIFIGCDPDDRPSPGFVSDMVKTLITNPDIGVLGMNFWVIDQRFKEGRLTTRVDSNGTEIWIHPSVEMWNICAIRFQTVMNLGGFRQTYPYYGGFEAAFWQQLQKENLKVAYLKNHSADFVQMNRDDQTLFDPEYRQWKTDHVNKEFAGSFEEWLIHHNKGNRITDETSCSHPEH